MSIHKEIININDLKFIRSFSDESLYRLLGFLLEGENEWIYAKGYLEALRMSLRSPVPLQEIDVAIFKKE